MDFKDYILAKTDITITQRSIDELVSISLARRPENKEFPEKWRKISSNLFQVMEVLQVLKREEEALRARNYDLERINLEQRIKIEELTKQNKNLLIVTGKHFHYLE